MGRKKMIRSMMKGAAVGVAAGALIALTRGIRPNKRVVRAARSFGPVLMDMAWGYFTKRTDRNSGGVRR